MRRDFSLNLRSAFAKLAKIIAIELKFSLETVTFQPSNPTVDGAGRPVKVVRLTRAQKETEMGSAFRAHKLHFADDGKLRGGWPTQTAMLYFLDSASEIQPPMRAG